MNENISTQRVVIVAGPQGFDMQAALFSEGVNIGEADMVVTIERPGNIEVEVLEPDPE